MSIQNTKSSNIEMMIIKNINCMKSFIKQFQTNKISFVSNDIDHKNFQNAPGELIELFVNVRL